MSSSNDKAGREQEATVPVDGWGVVVALVVGGLAYLGVVQGIRSGRRESAGSTRARAGGPR